MGDLKNFSHYWNSSAASVLELWRTQSSVWTLPKSGKVILCIFYVLIFLFGTVGNGSVIYTLLIKKKAPKKQGRDLILVLAGTDFISSIAMPFVMVNDIASNFNWYFGFIGCYIFPSLNNLFLFASAWILVAISWERRRYVTLSNRIILKCTRSKKFYSK